MYKWTITIFFSLWLLSIAGIAYAAELISNKTPKINSLSVNLARAIFSGRMKYWSDGTPVLVVMLKSNTDAHRQFCSEILQLYPRQLQRSWDMIIFSGVGEGPLVVKTEDELVEKVNSTPGAIGYISNFTRDMEVQIVEVK